MTCEAYAAGENSSFVFIVCVNQFHFIILRSLQLFFKKLAKSHISAQFFVRVFVLGWYTYFETAQDLFSLCFREKGVKTLKIYDFHEVLFKNFLYFLCL